MDNIQWQSESKKSGDEFEANVLNDLQFRGFKSVRRNVYMPGTGCEIDFLTDNPDNVKKAIANASLIKAIYSDITNVVYFSEVRYLEQGSEMTEELTLF